MALPSKLPRVGQVGTLALRDLRHGWVSTLCLSVAVAAALLPLLILFGLKFGVVNNLIDTLRSDPNVREVRLVRDTELSLDWFDRIEARTDVAFLLPRTNFLAASIRLRGTDRRSLLETRMVPTITGDPLTEGLQTPQDMTEIVIATRVALEAKAKVGDQVELVIQRTVNNQREAQRLMATVVGIVPRDRLQTDDILVYPALETSVESWRQGFAVPELEWTADDGTLTRLRPDRATFSSFRLYVTDVRDVPIVRDVLLSDGLDVRTRAEEVLRVLVIERALTLIFLAIATLSAIGFVLTMGLHLAATVVEQARELAILRLLGMSTAELSLLPSMQGMVIAAAGSLLAALLALTGQPVINTIFGGLGGIEGDVSRLRPDHFIIAVVATVIAGGISGSVAGARSSMIEPRRGLRHD